MTIYRELVQRVNEGETFYVDFEKRTMKVGKDFLIKDGKYDTTRELYSEYFSIPSLPAVLQMIRQLYELYKHSLPSERSENKRRNYFKALSIDELTDEQLMFAEKREYSQAALEGFVLCTILLGALYWDNAIMGKWFWQSKDDPDLVLLRSWIENKNN
jgi:hypothetical protein